MLILILILKCILNPTGRMTFCIPTVIGVVFLLYFQKCCVSYYEGRTSLSERWLQSAPVETRFKLNPFGIRLGFCTLNPEGLTSGRKKSYQVQSEPPLLLPLEISSSPCFTPPLFYREASLSLSDPVIAKVLWLKPSVVRSK